MPISSHPDRSAHPSVGRRASAGFSLVELSVVMAIISAVAVMGLELMASYMSRTAYKVTEERLAVIDQAMARYARTHRRLPCPASQNDSSNATCYGKERNGTAGGCDTYTASCAASTVSGGGAFWGHVPARDLGLPLNAMVDGYGNRIFYVVTQNQVYSTTHHATNNFDQTADAIVVRSGKIDQNCGGGGDLCQNRGNASYFLFSPGADKRGGYLKSGLATPCHYGPPDATVDGMIDTVNCRITLGNILTLKKTGNVDISPALAGVVFYDSRYNAGSEEYNHFDDLVKWRPKSGI